MDDSIFTRDRELSINLILLNLKDFLYYNMNGLVNNLPCHGCFNKKVTFWISGQVEFCFKGGIVDTLVQLISIMKAQSLLKKGNNEEQVPIA